ncbi:VP5 [Drosophila B birnavirus]|uniref:VP5 n=1 Tax=Drosophila B birnavirus TaxID=3070834 RepID=D0U494_9VIRU|nr:VP5 [Drosophila melanogaster birnavirus SW-2009a]ACU32791.1 VP5 [Drosophila melanogaster birnavirus SW-2009a]
MRERYYEDTELNNLSYSEQDKQLKQICQTSTLDQSSCLREVPPVYQTTTSAVIAYDKKQSLRTLWSDLLEKGPLFCSLTILAALLALILSMMTRANLTNTPNHSLSPNASMSPIITEESPQESYTSEVPHSHQESTTSQEQSMPPRMKAHLRR